MKIFLLLDDIKNDLWLLLIISKGFLVIAFKIFILNVIKTFNDNILFMIDNHIIYKSKFDCLSDSDESNLDSDFENEDEEGGYENKLYDMVKFNCDIDEYKFIPDNLYNYKFVKKNNYIIINSFLFNVSGNAHKIVDIHQFTKKLIVLYYLEDSSINTKTIRDIMGNYNYLYIYYRNDNDEFKVNIIDLNNNYEIMNKKDILFNNIAL